MRRTNHGSGRVHPSGTEVVAGRPSGCLGFGHVPAGRPAFSSTDQTRPNVLELSAIRGQGLPGLKPQCWEPMCIPSTLHSSICSLITHLSFTSPVRLIPYPACSASFFSRNSIFLSQHFSQNSVFQPRFSKPNGATVPSQAN